VRYRYDEKTNKRYTTVELIVDEYLFLTTHKVRIDINSMPKSSPTSIQPAKPNTPEQWREIWLEKMARALSYNKFKQSTAHGFVEIVDQYLASHTCHPGMIPEEKAFEFLA
jgi:hypothetical protein